MGRKGSKPVAS